MDGTTLSKTYGLPGVHLVRVLTKRQLQMVQLLCSGFDKSDIARQLRLEQGTVYTTFCQAEERLRDASKLEGNHMPERMTHSMWVRWGVHAGLDREIVPRPRRSGS